MGVIRVASWNVNGIRACWKNGFPGWLQSTQAAVVLLQEIRAEPDQLPEGLQALAGWHSRWNPARIKKGYSGTGILSREAPLKVFAAMGHEEFDCEGRVLAAEFPGFIAVSAYFPNSQDGGRRLAYKIRFCEAIEEWLSCLRKLRKPLLLGGDYNIAPFPIDLARPEENEQTPGYLPEERAWMKNFLAAGWVDSFRHIHPTKVQYSWWSARTRARERGIGWRIDHHAWHKEDSGRILGAAIEDHVTGSDHCPVTVDLDLG